MPLALKISKRLFQNQRKGKLIFGASVWKRKCKHGKDNSALFLVFSLWMINLREKFWRPDKSKQEKNWVYSQSRPNIELCPILFNLLLFRCVEYFAPLVRDGFLNRTIDLFWNRLKPSEYSTPAPHIFEVMILYSEMTRTLDTRSCVCLSTNLLLLTRFLKTTHWEKHPLGKPQLWVWLIFVTIFLLNVFDGGWMEW